MGLEISRIERELHCEGQCQGECTGHKMVIDNHSTSNTMVISADDGRKFPMSWSDSRALLSMLKEILED